MDSEAKNDKELTGFPQWEPLPSDQTPLPNRVPDEPKVSCADEFNRSVAGFLDRVGEFRNQPEVPRGEKMRITADSVVRVAIFRPGWSRRPQRPFPRHIDDRHARGGRRIINSHERWPVKRLERRPVGRESRKWSHSFDKRRRSRSRERRRRSPSSDSRGSPRNRRPRDSRDRLYIWIDFNVTLC